MVSLPSEEFCVLVSRLLGDLHGDNKPNDAGLLQLHAIFGSMFVSALQLIDRREVVKIILPGGRHIYQVTSSTGSPYTLYIDLPDLPLLIDLILRPNQASPMHGSDELPPVGLEQGSMNVDPPPGKPAEPVEPTNGFEGATQLTFIYALRRSMEGLYCPCAGFGYNTLTGERNLLCKHLLAVVLAHCMGREVRTEVGIRDVIHLIMARIGPAGTMKEGAEAQQEVIAA